MTGFRRLAVILFLGATSWLAAPAALADRILPRDIRIGDLEGIDVGNVQISGRLYTRAPGSRFRDRNNHIVLPNAAPAQGRVAFTFDLLGNVLGIWLLTDSEAAAFEGTATTQ